MALIVKGGVLFNEDGTVYEGALDVEALGNTAVTPQEAPADAAVPFASLTTAAQAYNSLKDALVASGVLTEE